MRVSLSMQYAQQAEELEKRRSLLGKEVSQLREKRHQLRLQEIDQKYGHAAGDPDDTLREIALIDQEIDTKEVEQTAAEEQFHEALFNSHKFYLRPERGFPELLSRFLGPVPQFMPVISPDQEKLTTVRSYRWSGFALFACAISVLVGLVTAVPWLGVSPAILLLSLYGNILPSWLAMICTVVSGYWFVRLLSGDMAISRHCKGKPLDRAAMHEEQWFRAGAESWSIWQRIYSCAAFGAVHLVNFIYPVASLIVVGLVGAVFMATYLREYRRSGSYERAALASAKLHAAYNRFAFAYMAVAVCILIIIGFFV